jgi:hypothetical protein
MTNKYTKERIAELLREIPELVKKLEDVGYGETLGQTDLTTWSAGYATLVVAKAKLTAMQGE